MPERRAAAPRNSSRRWISELRGSRPRARQRATVGEADTAHVRLFQFVALAPAGVGEELLTRGLGFNALRRGLGDKAAVILSSVIFGALHIFNPHASWLAALMVALVGIWFGTMTVKTGSVWLSVGVHLSWNFFEAFLYGQPVSDNAPKLSLFVAGTETTAQFWSGGDFGPEAAGFTALVLVAALLLATFTERPASQ